MGNEDEEEDLDKETVGRQVGESLVKILICPKCGNGNVEPQDL